jgi:hypothetical protein
MIGKVLDVLVLVEFPVIRLERHAVITHGIGPVLAEVEVPTSRNLPILGSPVLIHGVFFNILPRPACSRGSSLGRESFVRGAFLRSS